MSSEAGVCGQRSWAEECMYKTAWCDFPGCCPMNKGNLTLEMVFTPCKSDRCFGESRKLLII